MMPIRSSFILFAISFNLAGCTAYEQLVDTGGYCLRGKNRVQSDNDPALFRLEAGEPAEISVNLSERLPDCSTLGDTWCTASVAGDLITLHAEATYEVDKRIAGSCNTDIVRAIAFCETPPLSAGFYCISYGGKIFARTVMVPEEAPVLNVGAADCGWAPFETARFTIDKLHKWSPQ